MGDQPQAIEKLSEGLIKNIKHQVLLGVTGSGKTFTIANVIERVQKPTLVISHNKTLAAQLYQEFRDLFPENAVSYFVSYYDYYQPEAYIPSTDTYIEKETEINEYIDKLRLAATTNLLTRKDTIVVASVSCIYNLGSPVEYGKSILELSVGINLPSSQIVKRLAQLQYKRSNYDLTRGTFRVRGDMIDIFPAYKDAAVRVFLEEDKVSSINYIDPISGEIINDPEKGEKLVGIAPPGSFKSTVIYPAKHYLASTEIFENAISQIKKDLEVETKELEKSGKILEARRLRQRVEYDLQMIQEVGYVNGIENYSRYFDGRKPGDPPYTLLDYFNEPYKNNFLVVIDESHMTIPQIRGMYEGDASRKKILVDFGFRLKSCFDNRPLTFKEFLEKVPFVIYTSATPAAWERRMSERSALAIKNPPSGGIVEQLVRPTGIPDPQIEIRPTNNQIPDLIKEIQKRVDKKQRILVTTLTKRMAEDLSSHLAEKGIKVHYLHSEIHTLDRSDILDDLRTGKYDVIVGINLLREGLDLPEVSLVAILDADKEGFLRSDTSLIQIMGRASRHMEGKIIMYADTVTESIKRALDEVERRRKYQIEFNEKHKIIPKSVTKPIREKLIQKSDETQIFEGTPASIHKTLEAIDPSQLPHYEKIKILKRLRKLMKEAATDLDFELAAEIRDKIYEIKNF